MVRRTIASGTPRPRPISRPSLVGSDRPEEVGAALEAAEVRVETVLPVVVAVVVTVTEDGVEGRVEEDIGEDGAEGVVTVDKPVVVGKAIVVDMVVAAGLARLM